MKDTRKNEIKVGVISFLAIVLFIIGISLGKDFKMSSSETIIKLRFPNSGGIQPSSPVVVNGVKRGYVKSIVNDRNTVVITAGIDNVDDFKRDVSAKITILEITGGKKIEISPGIVQDKYTIDHEIEGVNSADIADLVALVGDLGGDAKSFLKKFDNIAANLDKLVGNEKFTGDIQKIVNNTENITTELNDFINKNLNDLNITLKNIKTLTNDITSAYNKYEPRVDTLTLQLVSAMSDAKVLINNIKTSLAKVDNVVADVNDITGEIKTGKGLVGKMIYDKNFSKGLDTNLTNLFKFIDMIQQHGININARLGTRP